MADSAAGTDPTHVKDETELGTKPLHGDAATEGETAKETPATEVRYIYRVQSDYFTVLGANTNSL